jgi:hypothetical protein
MLLTMPAPWVIAVTVSIGVSFCTVTGFAMQAFAVRDAGEDDKAGRPAKWMKIGELVLSPLWIVGAILQAVPNLLGDVLAYTLAPMSLTAPLSGVSVVLNTTLAPRLLGEKMHLWPDLPATMLILVGTIFTTSMGAHHDVEVSSVLQLQQLALRPEALALMGGISMTVVVSLLLQFSNSKRIEDESAAKFENPSIMKVALPAWTAAGMAALSNIALKAFSELLKISVNASIVCFSVCVFPCAMVQIQSINRGLRLYPQTVFFPIYSSLLVLANSLFGSLIFQEYVEMTSRTMVLFGLGVGSVMAGITLYSQRDTKEADQLCTAAGSSEPLLSQSKAELGFSGNAPKPSLGA